MKKRNVSAKGIFNWSFLIIAFAIIILVNIIASLVYVQFDMTDDKRYTLAKGTKEFLSNKSKFENRISIKIYLEGNLPAEIKLFRDAIEDKLRAFKDLTGNRIEYVFINPNNGSESEKNDLFKSIYKEGKGIQPLDISYIKDGEQTQLMLWPGAEISYSNSGVIKENTIQFLPGTKPGNPLSLQDVNEVLENALNNLEYNLLSAIRNITLLEKPRIAFLQGHGELNYNQTIRARSVIAPFYSLTEITLNDSLAALNDVDGLIIADPQTPFTDKDLYIIDQFVMRGGKLMCFMNTLHLEEDSLMSRGLTNTLRKNLKLGDMLMDYGMKLNENYVYDVLCAPKKVPFADKSLMPWFFHVLGTPSPHPITRNVDPVSLHYVNEIKFIPSDKIKTSSLITSSTNSNKTGLAPLVSLEMPLSFGNNPKLVDNPLLEKNKICLAGMIEGRFSSFFANKIVAEFADNKNSNYLNQSKVEGKILLVGNGTFIANKYDSIINEKTGEIMYRPKPFNDLKFNQTLAEMNKAMYYGNQEFFENVVDYMMGEISILDIRSRQIDIKNIDKAKLITMSGTLKIINVFLPIVLILIFAFIWNFRRKNKYASMKNSGQ